MFWKKEKLTEDNVKTVEWRSYKDKTYEELEKEVDEAYLKYFIKNAIKCLVACFIVMLILHDIVFYFVKFATPRKASEILAAEKSQINITAPDIKPLPPEEDMIYMYKTLEDNQEIELHKIAKYTVEAKEVSKGYLFFSSYLPWNKAQKIMERVALCDIGIVWGNLASPNIIKKYNFISGKDIKNRKIYPRLSIGTDKPPIPWTQMGDSMSHIQVIPANSNVMYALIHSKKLRPLKLEGYLVNVYIDRKCIAANELNKSYLNRDVRNGGDKKIMLVEKVQLGNKVYE